MIWVEVESTGKQVPPSINTFQDIPFHPHVLEIHQRSDYNKPTPTQVRLILCTPVFGSSMGGKERRLPRSNSLKTIIF